ncbi:hypothetical protein DSL72_004504 [Monilinia vaccinii-corymbosi]|uniref:Uncharacterized protein n=1 Tax=Monilinia vaccinii-corymbosi TaxID=61207 RepID=A0A8A3P3Z3_9HELO|nr:hypothetical protein DSL72_004504 [Monilinia vaccinii-corymbosi]
MLNFGILEVAPSTTKAAPAPGWAYVPDFSHAHSHSHSSAAPQLGLGLQPSSRRARLGAQQVVDGGGRAHDVSKKQDAKIVRELLVLDRENHRDVVISVSAGGKTGKERREGRSPHKLTPSVRKILASQKTFANHLSDYEALASLPSSQAPQGASPAVSSSTPVAAPGSGLTRTGKRSHKRKEATPSGAEAALTAPAPKRIYKKKEGHAHAHTPAVSTPLRQSSTSAPKSEPELSIATPASASPSASPSSPPSTFTPLLASSLPPPKPHPRDHDPLLISRVPALPSPAELQRLLDMPALSYHEARGGWTPEDRRKPARVFCESYWDTQGAMENGKGNT